MQRLASEKGRALRRAGCHVAWHRGLGGPILQASSEHFRPTSLLAALVLKIDTIPKLDGLGPVLQTADIEQNSIDFGR
jgi:hypothetical protein